jgi:rubrerythrin
MNFLLKIIGDIITVHTEQGTTQINDPDRAAKLRADFAKMETQDLWICPVCKETLTERGYLCETCSNDVRR